MLGLAGLLVVNRRQRSYLGLAGTVQKDFKTKQVNTRKIDLQSYEDLFYGFTVTQTGLSTYLYSFTAKQSRSSNHLWPRGPDCGNSLCHVRRKREVNAPVIPSASYHGHIIIKGCEKHLPICVVFRRKVHPEVSHVT